jgi:uncharacterized membrane protein
MSTVRGTIDVAVPARVAYDRLCHLENYAQFMSGVTDSTRLSDTSAHLVMDLAGTRAEFDARITEQRPGELVTWQAAISDPAHVPARGEGAQLCETVRLEALSDSKTRVIAELQIDAEQLMPSEAHAQDVLNRRLKADLRGFKKYVERSAAHLAQPPAASSALPPSMAQSPAAHASNERPRHAIPPTGNLGPLHGSGGRRAPSRRTSPPGPGRTNNHSSEHGDSF